MGNMSPYNIWLKANLSPSQRHLETGCARVIWPKVIVTLAMGNAHGKLRSAGLVFQPLLKLGCIQRRTDQVALGHVATHFL